MTYEDLKNYLKTQEWKVKKQEQDILGGNPNAVSAYDMLSGMDSGGISGIIRDPKKIRVQPTPDEPEWPDLHATIEETYGPVFEYDEKILGHLENLANQYKRVIGTVKDPVYDLIKSGKINSDNIDLVALSAPGHYEKLKDIFLQNPNYRNEYLSKVRDPQNLPYSHYNDEIDKKALEEMYDSQVATSAFTDGNKSIRYDYYADPLISMDAFDANPKVDDIYEMINSGLIPEGAMRNKRIGLNDFIKARIKFDANKNAIGRQGWESTKPILDLGEYAWHKLPYDTAAQRFEGKKMANCAGDFCVAAPGDKDIYSLRRSETNTPKVNFVHQADGTIEQIKGVANSEPKEEYLDAIEQLKKYLGIR